jgi:hypothetical protein
LCGGPCETQALLLSHPAKDTRDLALYAPLQRSGADGVGGARKGLRVLAAEVLGLEIQVRRGQNCCLS